MASDRLVKNASRGFPGRGEENNITDHISDLSTFLSEFSQRHAEDDGEGDEPENIGARGPLT